MQKKLFLLEQLDNLGWDTYDSCIVCAENELEAAKIHPASIHYEVDEWCIDAGDWAKSPLNVQVTFLGIADNSIELNSVICASFNAG